MKKEILAPATVHKALRYAHAVKVGDTVYIAGQAAFNLDFKLIGLGDVVAQSHQVFQNLKAILESVGGRLDDIVALTTFLRNMDDLAKYREVREKYLGIGTVPATTIEVTKLALPEMLVECEAIAVIGCSQ